MRFCGTAYLIKSFILSLFFYFSAVQLSAQGVVKGKVLDSLSSDPLSFASVRIFQSNDKKLIGGNITTEAGDFSIALSSGSYYGEIEFMGYKTYTITPFSITNERTNHNLGT